MNKQISTFIEIVIIWTLLISAYIFRVHVDLMIYTAIGINLSWLYYNIRYVVARAEEASDGRISFEEGTIIISVFYVTSLIGVSVAYLFGNNPAGNYVLGAVNITLGIALNLVILKVCGMAIHKHNRFIEHRRGLKPGERCRHGSYSEEICKRGCV